MCSYKLDCNWHHLHKVTSRKISWEFFFGIMMLLPTPLWFMIIEEKFQTYMFIAVNHFQIHFYFCYVNDLQKKKDSGVTTTQYLWKWGIHVCGQKRCRTEVLVVVICRWNKNITVPEGSTRFHLNSVYCYHLYQYIIIIYIISYVLTGMDGVIA